MVEDNKTKQYSAEIGAPAKAQVGAANMKKNTEGTTFENPFLLMLPGYLKEFTVENMRKCLSV